MRRGLPTRWPRPSVPRPQGLEAGCSVEFELELLGYEREPNQHELEGEERLQRGGRLKQQGNELYKQVGRRMVRGPVPRPAPRAPARRPGRRSQLGGLAGGGLPRAHPVDPLCTKARTPSPPGARCCTG